MNDITHRPTAEDRFAEAVRYFENGREADWKRREGVGADEDGRYRVEGRFAHQWFALARVTAPLAGKTLEDVQAVACLEPANCPDAETGMPCHSCWSGN